MGVTVEYIARMANVSKATVSRVLNNKTEGVSDKTRQRVLELIETYHYNVHQNTKSGAGRAKNIGLIIPDITNPFFAEVVKSIDDYVSAYGYIVMLCNTDSSAMREENYISTLIAQKVDGVILVSTVGENQNAYDKLKKYNIPCVLLDRKMKNMEYVASVYIDNEYALFTAAEYLIHNGNENIALFLGPSYLSASSERLEGYRSALKHYRLTYNPDLVVWGDFTLQSGYNSVLHLHNNKKKFTAVLASSDVIAIGAMRGLKSLGYSVPLDIEVIGFDNIMASEMVDPPLSTIEQPIYELGRHAAEVLIATIEGKTLREKNVRLETRLIIRNSTK